MPILQLVLILALIGVVVWLVTTYIPMPAQIKTLIIVAVVILLVIWIIQLTGLVNIGPNVPRVR
jgi:hypothetical protein